MSTAQAPLAKRIIVENLTERRKEFEGRLPAGMSVDRFLFGLKTAIQKNPKLEECTPQSVFLAAYEAAEFGCDLSPSRAMGWIIPYGQQAQFQPSYRHFIQMAYRSGVVKSFFAECVYADDKFRLVYAPHRTIQHEPAIDERGMPVPASERGERRGAYALIEFTDGHFDFVYCDEELIDKHRRHSKQPDSLMWTKFSNEGACKTAIRLLFKRAPEKNEALVRVAEAVNKDAETDRTEPVEPGRIEFQAPARNEPEEIAAELGHEPAAEPIVYKGKLTVRWGKGEDQDLARMKPETVATFKLLEKEIKPFGTFAPTAKEWIVVGGNVPSVHELAVAHEIEWIEVTP